MAAAGGQGGGAPGRARDGGGVAVAGGGDGGAHVGLGDLRPRTQALGQHVHRAPGRAPGGTLAAQAHAAAGGLHQHAEGVLDQGGVASVRAGDRAHHRVVVGQELFRLALARIPLPGVPGAQAAAPNARMEGSAVAATTRPDRLLGPAASISTGVMRPIRSRGASAQTAWR